MENKDSLPLTLEQAAGNHSRRACVTHVQLNRSAQEIDNIAFQAGAEWQKAQLFNLIRLVKEGMPVLLCEGFEELAEQIDNELEQLQD